MHTGLSQPRDPDAIKLFVGQIPKGWNEPEVREILQAFGPIHELTILRDRVTGLHKGEGMTRRYRHLKVDFRDRLRLRYIL